MKTRMSKDESFDKSRKKKKNMMRLGGGGLSLEAFASAKSMSNGYNPALIKKQKEFYKNAKFVRKYKKIVKQENQQNDLSSRPLEEDKDNNGDASEINKKDEKKKKKKNRSYSLGKLYKKKREEDEKARIERETIIQVKKEEREKAMARRKTLREKMFKKTRKGQPVMKYRIEHLLESIQSSTN